MLTRTSQLHKHPNPNSSRRHTHPIRRADTHTLLAFCARNIERLLHLVNVRWRFLFHRILNDAVRPSIYAEQILGAGGGGRLQSNYTENANIMKFKAYDNKRALLCREALPIHTPENWVTPVHACLKRG
jgi:hypothetical protein